MQMYVNATQESSDRLKFGVILKLKSFSLVLFLIFVIGCSSSKTNDESYSLNINYSFSGLKDGYDHLNKIIIYFDGIPAGTSSKKYESEPNSVSVEAYPGKIHVKIENIVYYDGCADFS